MIIKLRFKIYTNIVCDDNKTLYQLEHFKNKRTYPFRKLTYNKDRKAYRIYGQWVSKKRLRKFMYEVNEVLREDIEDSFLQSLDMCLENINQ